MAWQQCRQAGAVFLLRIEDIDTPRNVPGSEGSVIRDLRWLGIEWDEGPDLGGPAGPYRQSDRGHLYEEALRELAEQGLIYPCCCSRKDLRNSASAPHGNEGPFYPGTCRPSQPVPVQLDLKRDCSWRFRVDTDPHVKFTDEAKGEQQVDLAGEHGDFVVRRRDGLWAYQLACAVDDGLMGVTHVLRGEDLLDSTPRQVTLLRALQLPLPTYRHVSLVLDTNGQRMSKRDGSLSLASLRARGLTPTDAREAILQWNGSSSALASE